MMIDSRSDGLPDRDLARLRATTAALRDVLLVPDLPAEDLRTRLLAELLTDRTS